MIDQICTTGLPDVSALQSAAGDHQRKFGLISLTFKRSPQGIDLSSETTYGWIKLVILGRPTGSIYVLVS